MRQQVNMHDTALVITDANGNPATTSLKVAERFEKEHRHVLRDIEALDCSGDFTESNFGLSEYKDPTGRNLKLYIMTRDGFTFLGMGYRGKRAAKFKEDYIAAFNAMEEELRGRHASGSYDPMEIIEAVKDACRSIDLGPCACQAVARDFGVRIGAPADLLPPRLENTSNRPALPAPTVEDQKETIASALKARRLELGLTPAKLAEKMHPDIAPWKTGPTILKMEEGKELTEENLAAAVAVLGGYTAYLTTPGATVKFLPVPLSLLRRFPSIPDLLKAQESLDHINQPISERDRLVPAKVFAIDVLEACVG